MKSKSRHWRLRKKTIMECSQRLKQSHLELLRKSQIRKRCALRRMNWWLTTKKFNNLNNSSHLNRILSEKMIRRCKINWIHSLLLLRNKETRSLPFMTQNLTIYLRKRKKISLTNMLQRWKRQKFKSWFPNQKSCKKRRRNSQSKINSSQFPMKTRNL